MAHAIIQSYAMLRNYIASHSSVAILISWTGSLLLAIFPMNRMYCDPELRPQVS